MKTTRTVVALLTVALISSPGWTAAGEKSDTTTEMAWTVELPMGFDAAMETLTQALSAEQFSIVSRVEMHTIFKKKGATDRSPQAGMYETSRTNPES